MQVEYIHNIIDIHIILRVSCIIVYPSCINCFHCKNEEDVCVLWNAAQKLLVQAYQEAIQVLKKTDLLSIDVEPVETNAF